MNGPPLELHARLPGINEASPERFDASLYGGAVLSPAALGWKLGFVPAADVVIARGTLGMEPAEGWLDEIARGAAAHFPVSAADLMPALQGPALGTRLKALEAAWLASDLKAGREELLS